MRSRPETDRLAPEAADEELARSAAAGSSEAFDALVRRHQRAVYSLARRMVRTHEDADEVAQESFLRAWQGLAGYDAARPFRPWLHRIVTNTALNHLRAIRGRREEDLDGTDGPAARLPAPGRSPEADEGSRQAIAAIGRAMSRLKPEERAVLHLRVHEDLSYAEIAAALGVRIGTVMSRLFRARAAFRRELTREGVEP